MPGQYLYSVELSINDCDLWTYPDNLKDIEDKKTFIRFQMNPSIVLEITEDEYLDQVNCDTTVVKNAMFSLSEQQIKSDVGAKIVVSKLLSPEKEIVIGCYNISKLHSSFKRIMEHFDSQEGNGGDPCIEVVKELVQLVNSKDQPSGSVHYTLRLSCFGPTISKNKGDNSSLCSVISELAFLSKSTMKSTNPSTHCRSETAKKSDKNSFDEYAAEVNGNELILRVNKGESSHLVTRVFDYEDSCFARKEKNVVSISGCDQQFDLNLPQKSSCCGWKKKSKSGSICSNNSVLTDYQRQTSCNGGSYRNSCKIPAIHGNLKYPGKLDIDSINSKVLNCWNHPRDSTKQFVRKLSNSRAICLQADRDNEFEGKCKLPKGIEVCRKGFADPDSDVFILKIGKKNSNKAGQNNGIEIEMRTPKGPDNEVKKMETREVQVNEKEFETEKPLEKKTVIEKAKTGATKGFVKKSEAGVSKPLMKKKK